MAHIDMLIDRADSTVSVCEMKYAHDGFEMTMKEAEGIRRRVALFTSATKTRKSMQVVLVSTFGMKRSKHSGVVHREVTLDDLFRDA